MKAKKILNNEDDFISRISIDARIDFNQKVKKWYFKRLIKTLVPDIFSLKIENNNNKCGAQASIKKL